MCIYKEFFSTKNDNCKDIIKRIYDDSKYIKNKIYFYDEYEVFDLMVNLKNGDKNINFKYIYQLYNDDYSSLDVINKCNNYEEYECKLLKDLKFLMSKIIFNAVTVINFRYKCKTSKKFKCDSINEKDSILSTASASGFISLVRYRINKYSYKKELLFDAIKFSSQYEKLDIFIYLIEHFKKTCDICDLYDTLKLCIRHSCINGNLDILKYTFSVLFTGTVIYNISKDLLYASLNGHLHIIKYIKFKSFKINNYVNILIIALRNNHFDIVEYIVPYIKILNLDKFEHNCTNKQILSFHKIIYKLYIRRKILSKNLYHALDNIKYKYEDEDDNLESYMKVV